MASVRPIIFYASLHTTFERLADQPFMGRRFRDLRRHDHKSYAIFYQPISDGVIIAQIYHHSEDILARLK
ncbi:MAG: type II toxin-antitoxin system RelE/ParE family toxin [Asticcacaulis sp.]